MRQGESGTRKDPPGAGDDGRPISCGWGRAIPGRVLKTHIRMAPAKTYVRVASADRASAEPPEPAIDAGPPASTPTVNSRPEARPAVHVGVLAAEPCARSRARRARRLARFAALGLPRNIVFAGAIPCCGSSKPLPAYCGWHGNMNRAAVVTCSGAVFLVQLSPCLSGLGPVKRWGCVARRREASRCLLPDRLRCARRLSMVRPQAGFARERGARLRGPLFERSSVGPAAPRCHGRQMLDSQSPPPA